MQDHRRIAKMCQDRRSKQLDRLQDIFQQSPADVILLDACARKKAADVKSILTGLPSLNPDTIRDRHLQTPLHIACGRRDDPADATLMARILIQRGSDVNNGTGDVDGLQPMHMAVLAGNIECVLMLLEQGSSVPASDPFRLTPLLLAKFKLDNLRQSRQPTASSTAQHEYNDLEAITRVLVTHLANKHTTTTSSSRPNHGLSERLLARTSTQEDHPLHDMIASITDQLSTLGMEEHTLPETTTAGHQLQENLDELIERVRQLNMDTPY